MIRNKQQQQQIRQHNQQETRNQIYLESEQSSHTSLDVSKEQNNDKVQSTFTGMTISRIAKLKAKMKRKLPMNNRHGHTGPFQFGMKKSKSDKGGDIEENIDVGSTRTAGIGNERRFNQNDDSEINNINSDTMFNTIDKTSTITNYVNSDRDNATKHAIQRRVRRNRSHIQSKLTRLTEVRKPQQMNFDLNTLGLIKICTDSASRNDTKHDNESKSDSNPNSDDHKSTGGDQCIGTNSNINSGMKAFPLWSQWSILSTSVQSLSAVRNWTTRLNNLKNGVISVFRSQNSSLDYCNDDAYIHARPCVHEDGLYISKDTEANQQSEISQKPEQHAEQRNENKCVSNCRSTSGNFMNRVHPQYTIASIILPGQISQFHNGEEGEEHDQEKENGNDLQFNYSLDINSTHLYQHHDYSSLSLRKMMLKIGVGIVQIENHPLFLPEEIHAAELMHLYRKLRFSKERQNLEYCCDRIATIVSAMFNMRQKVSMVEEEGKFDVLDESTRNTDIIDRIHELYNELICCISTMISVEKEIHDNYLSVLDKWSEVSKDRDQQGFQCSTVSLLRRTWSPNESQLKTRPGSTFFKHTARHLSDMSNALDSMENMTTWIEELLPSKLNRNYTEEVKSIVSMMKLVQSARSSQYDILLITGDESKLSNIANFPTEQKRRNQLRSDRYIGKLIINGVIVETTEFHSIQWPTWRINFDQEICCCLSSMPNMVCLQIYRQRCMGLAPDEIIGSTFVGVPGTASRLEFSLLDLISPYEESYHFQNETIGGEIGISSEWLRLDTLQKSDDFCMPIDDVNTQKHYLEGICTTTHRTRNANEEKFSTVDQMIMNESSSSFRMRASRFSFLNANRFQEPLRHYLIKQRESYRTHNSIPLDEADISADMVKNLIADRKSKHRFEDDLVEKACRERIATNRESLQEYITRNRQYQHQGMSRSKDKIGLDDIVHDASRIRAQDPKLDFLSILNSIFPPRKRSLYQSQPSTRDTYRGRSTKPQQQTSLIVTVINATNVLCREESMLSNVTPFLTSPPLIRRFKSSNLPSFTTSTSSHRIKESEKIRKQKSGSQKETVIFGESNTIVQLKFCGKSYETRPDKKRNPSWRQVFEFPFPFDQEDGCTPLQLKELEEHIEITLFDVVEGSRYDKEEPEKHFLSNLRIPISNVLKEDNQQRTYTLRTPDIVLGYSHKAVGRKLEKSGSNQLASHRQHGLHSSARTNDIESHVHHESFVNKKRTTSLNLMVTMTPSIPLIDCPQIIPSNNDYSKIQQHAVDWVNRYSRVNLCGSRRPLPILAVGSNGRQNIITSFLRAQPPPPHCRESLSQCAHYVSLIPSLNSWKALKHHFHDKVWMTSRSVLNIAAADAYERAALLANYFMYMSQEGKIIVCEVYLVVGNSLTEDNAMYVMTRESKNGKIYIWNPSNGESFTQDDEMCPCDKITLLIEYKGIYGNLQMGGKPCCINFDLDDEESWDSCFDSLHPHEKYPISIQEPMLYYREPNDDLAPMLEIEIIEKVKASIRSWRRIPSIFNNDISNRLRIIISDLEERRFNGLAPPSPSEYCIPLEGLCRGKRIFGFPLQSGFSSVPDIIEKVQSSSISESKHPNVEFGVATRVFPYASSMFSVWVFLCTITPESF